MQVNDVRPLLPQPGRQPGLDMRVAIGRLEPRVVVVRRGYRQAEHADALVVAGVDRDGRLLRSPEPIDRDHRDVVALRTIAASEPLGAEFDAAEEQRRIVRRDQEQLHRGACPTSTPTERGCQASGSVRTVAAAVASSRRMMPIAAPRKIQCM